MSTNKLSPVQSSERYIILDALRGFALLGICMANFPEFALYTFLKPEVTATMPTATIDNVLRFLLYVFVDGKFYTIFSLLFGIGFSIIIANAAKKGKDGFHVFYRRMFILLLIGFVHLMFIWSGDILMLYALLGMLLPLFRNVSDRKLLLWAGCFLFLPVVVDFICEVTTIYPSSSIVRLQEYYCAQYGITDDNFAYWLRDATGYKEVFHFLIQGALVRIQEFVDGNRYFKVMGLFLIGFYIGRKQVYANLNTQKQRLKLFFRYGTIIGLPLSILYAWSAMSQHRLGLTVHSLLYFASVYTFSFAYMSGLCLLYMQRENLSVWNYLAAPGRMALSNYIGQSVIGILLFYGIGLGWGANIGLVYVEMIVLVVYVFQILYSRMWLSKFRFGLLEWGWRILTYGKWFKLWNV